MEVTIDLRKEGPLVPESNENAPLYQTPIFENEETGDLREIELIVENNLDPCLELYADIPMKAECAENEPFPREFQELLGKLFPEVLIKPDMNLRGMLEAWIPKQGMPMGSLTSSLDFVLR